MCTENAQHERGCQAWRHSKVEQMLKLSVVKEKKKNKFINSETVLVINVYISSHL